MSFWGGMAKGMEAGLAKKEREESRDEDQAWREKMHSYQLGRDKIADARAAKSSELAEFNTMMDLASKLRTGSLVSRVGGKVSKSSNASDTTSEHSLKVMYKEGASPDVLETFAQYGPTVLAEGVAAWEKYKAAAKDSPQFAQMTIDDFLEQSIATKVEEGKPNLDAMSMFGIDLDAQVGSTGLSRRDVLSELGTVPERWDVTYFNSDTVPEKIDVEGILDAVSDGIVLSFKMKAVSLSKELERANNESNPAKQQRMAEDKGYETIEAYRAALSKAHMEVSAVTERDKISLEAYELADPNLLLSKFYNNPGALNYKWGSLWDRKIKDRTYSSLEGLAEAIRSGNLNAHDYYILEENGQKSLRQVPIEKQ